MERSFVTLALSLKEKAANGLKMVYVSKVYMLEGKKTLMMEAATACRVIKGENI